MPWCYQVWITPCDTFAPGRFEAVEGTAREIEVELCAVRRVFLPQAIQNLDGHATRIGGRLDHKRRYGPDQRQLGDPAVLLAVAGDVPGRFAAAGGVADVDGIPQIEVLHHRGSIRGVVVHVVTIAHLARPAMATAVMRDDAIALLHEVEHLGVPVVGAEWPPMMEDDGLSGPGSPVLVVDRRAILDCDRAHRCSSWRSPFYRSACSTRAPRPSICVLMIGPSTDSFVTRSCAYSPATGKVEAC